jgi:hypothetical protein
MSCQDAEESCLYGALLQCFSEGAQRIVGRAAGGAAEYLPAVSADIWTTVCAPTSLYSRRMSLHDESLI